MSRPPFIKQDKNVVIPSISTIPETIKDEIRSIVNSGEYGKLENLLINSSFKLTFAESGLNTSLLHGVIQSTLTKIQKFNICKLLLEKGISIDNLDENGFAPLYYAIKSQNYELVKLLIEKHAKVKTKFNYFQLALQPSISECKSQLFNIQDQAMMSKYYSQQMKLERNLKKGMNNLPITKEIVKYLLEFIQHLPEEKLKYIDLTDNNTPKETYSVKLEGNPDLTKDLPEFENKLYYSLENISRDIYSSLQSGEINEDQIISKKTDIISKIKQELKIQLDVNSVKSIPSLNKDFIYKPDEQFNYDNLFTPSDYNPRNMFNNLITKYRGIQNQLIKQIDQIRNLVANYPNVDPNLVRDIDNHIFQENNPDIHELNKYFLNIDEPDKLKNWMNFIVFIGEATTQLISIYRDLQFYDFFTPDRPNRAQNNIINDLKKIYESDNTISNTSAKINQFIIDINNITESGLLYKKFNDLPDTILFNNPFILSHNESDLDDINANRIDYLQKLSAYSQEIIKYYDVPESEMVARYNYTQNNELIDIEFSTNIPGDFANINNTSIMDKNNIVNLKVIASIYHEKVFNILFRQSRINNPIIRDEISDKLLLSTLDSAIKNNFNELVNLILTSASETLVNNKLLKNPNNIQLDDKINKILVKKLNLINIQRQKEDQQFYLDENYTSSEPIDIIPCINNDPKIIELLKIKMHIDPKEYQDLIFRLGNSDILKKLNTRNKISKLVLNMYLDRHTEKFKDSINFLNNQVQDESKAKQIDFLLKGTSYLIPSIDFDGNIDRKEILEYNFLTIYKDLIKKQTLSNQYLIKKLRIKLNTVFQDIILPQVKEFLTIFVESSNNLDQIINYDRIKDNLEPIINNIIYYHMNIDPTKSKEIQIPLETSVTAFSELFINFIDDSTVKTKLTSIYNEKLKSKITNLLIILCKYYGTVYRNFLKYIFNDTRYSKLDDVLTT